ncbi:type 3 dihydrofolate reductase [Magnetospira thiophila]
MRLSLIVALAENRVIGRANGLPWRIPGDLKHFKQITMGKAIIMGRKTFESIGRALPGRHNIAVSRDLAFAPDFVEVARTLDAALHAAAGWGDEEALVIGGAELYRQALPQVERLYLTEVHAQVEGDVLFPEWDREQWHELSRQRHEATDGAQYPYSFVTLERGPA